MKACEDCMLKNKLLSGRQRESANDLHNHGDLPRFIMFKCNKFRYYFKYDS